MATCLFNVIVAEGTTNLVVNPSFETGTTDWSTDAAHTLVQSSAQSYKGNYSGLWTDGGASTDMGIHILTLPTAATVYIAQAWIYVPAGWDGGNIRIVTGNFAGSSEDYDIIWTVGTDPTDEWFYIQTTLTVAADVVGRFVIQNTSSPSGGITCYIDAVQIEEASTVTTYCDGDQAGCEWLGTPHASQSSRSEVSRAGGILANLQSDYGFWVDNTIGAGVMAVGNNLDDYALLPGALWQNQKERIRQLSLVGLLSMCDLETGHNNRTSLINAFTKDYLGQAAILRYTGAPTIKELSVRYDTGLDFVGYKDRGNERLDLRLLAEDPYWYDIADQGDILDENDTATFRYSGARINGLWDDLGPPAAPATGGAIDVVTIGPDGLVYYGGDFTNWDGIAAADYIVSYDPVTDTWAALSALNGAVSDIIFGPDGTLYACGNFTNAGGVAAADYVAAWNGAAWAAVGDPNSGGAAIGSIIALAFGPDGTLYCGGNFTNLEGDANADYVAQFDGANWVAVGTGADGAVLDVVVDGDLVYIAGLFANAGGNAAPGVAVWDGSDWSDLDGSITGVGDGYALEVASDGTLYFGGTFDEVGGVTASAIASWNGIFWSNLGDGLTGGTPVVTVIRVAPDGIIYVSGKFTTAGDIALTDSIAKWNGFTWAHIDVDFSGNPNLVFDIGFPDPVLLTNYDIYCGGDTSGTAAFAGDTTVTNPGTAYAQPVIEIERSGGTSATIANIRNETTGREILMDYDLLDGETLTLDFTPGRQNVSSDFFGDRPGAVLKNSDFAIWGLLPGSNLITVFVIESGAPTVTVRMRYRASFKSFDD